MSLAKAKKAIMTAIEAGNFGLPIAHENVKFRKVDAPAYLELNYMPNPVDPITLGDDGEDELNGYMQITVNVQEGTGTGTTTAVTEALREYFYVGRNLTFEDVTVTVNRSGPKNGFPTQGRWETPFLVYFYARVPRRTS